MSDLSNLLGAVYGNDADGAPVRREAAAADRLTSFDSQGTGDELAAALSAALVDGNTAVPAPAPRMTNDLRVTPPQLQSEVPAPAPAPRQTWNASAPVAAPVASIPMRIWEFGDDDIVPGGARAKAGRR